MLKKRLLNSEGIKGKVVRWDQKRAPSEPLNLKEAMEEAVEETTKGLVQGAEGSAVTACIACDDRTGYRLCTGALTQPIKAIRTLTFKLTS